MAAKSLVGPVQRHSSTAPTSQSRQRVARRLNSSAVSFWAASREASAGEFRTLTSHCPAAVGMSSMCR